MNSHLEGSIIEGTPDPLVRDMVDESKHDGMERCLRDEGATRGERKENAGRQNEKEQCCEKRHHGVKHGGWISIVDEHNLNRRTDLLTR
jgi:hypothetical protein